MLDDIDEEDHYEAVEQRETRAEIERRIALEKLDARPFETVRQDTLEQIRDGMVKGNLNSFRSPTNTSACMSPSRMNNAAYGSRFMFSPRNNPGSSVFDVAGRAPRVHQGPFIHAKSPMSNSKVGSEDTGPEINSNPQAAAIEEPEIDPMFDERRTRNPETYFVPNPAFAPATGGDLLNLPGDING